MAERPSSEVVCDFVPLRAAVTAVRAFADRLASGAGAALVLTPSSDGMWLGSAQEVGGLTLRVPGAQARSGALPAPIGVVGVELWHALDRLLKAWGGRPEHARVTIQETSADVAVRLREEEVSIWQVPCGAPPKLKLLPRSVRVWLADMRAALAHARRSGARTVQLDVAHGIARLAGSHDGVTAVGCMEADIAETGAEPVLLDAALLEAVLDAAQGPQLHIGWKHGVVSINDDAMLANLPQSAGEIAAVPFGLTEVGSDWVGVDATGLLAAATWTAWETDVAVLQRSSGHLGIGAVDAEEDELLWLPSIRGGRGSRRVDPCCLARALEPFAGRRVRVCFGDPSAPVVLMDARQVGSRYAPFVVVHR